MDHTPFEYGGLRFIPERRFEPQGQYHRRIPLSPLVQDADANLVPSKFACSHSGFYKASMVKDCDIFRCVEDGQLYAPCGDGLRYYNERPAPERGRKYER